MKKEFALSDNLIIDNQHLTTVCKYRQSGCCKYIVAFPHGEDNQIDFFCVKNVPQLKSVIEEKTNEMAAKDDNCEGLRE